MSRTFPTKLSLLAIPALCLALAPVDALAADKKIIVKEPDKHKQIIIKEKKEVVVYPVRPWAKKPHYGQMVAGVTLGTLIAASAVGTAPLAPVPNVCWYWTDHSLRKGYWDYCY
jgi:hypothetical protein